MTIIILYASTSGSTRFVVSAMVDGLGAERAESFDIATLDTPVCLTKRALIVLVTPTYGTGDWHYVWADKGEMLLAGLPTGARVAVMALGDSRGHKKSFGGGVGKLAQLARAHGATLVGAVAASGYTFEASAAVEGDQFPGLVVEYLRNRHQATKQAKAWVRALVDDGPKVTTPLLSS